jgi:prephenate dehydratase
VRAGDPRRAAIASRRAAEIYRGCILQSHLEDHRENYTRFALLSAEPGVPAGANKISLVVFLLHQPGALHQALQPFAEHKINLVKIESRPIVGHPFEYCFYLDLMAAPQAPATQAALEELRRRTREVRILGYYVAAPAPGTS